MQVILLMLDLSTIDQFSQVWIWTQPSKSFNESSTFPDGKLRTRTVCPSAKEQLRAVESCLDLCDTASLLLSKYDCTVGQILLEESSLLEIHLRINQWLPDMQAGKWTESWQCETPVILCTSLKTNRQPFELGWYTHEVSCLIHSASEKSPVLEKQIMEQYLTQQFLIIQTKQTQRAASK